jgi:REP element-mobilizing transposase RayT
VSYWRCHYHLVWATKLREPIIDGERGPVLQRSFRATAHEHGAVIHAIGIMPDHVHVAVSIPPKISVSLFVKELKGSSSHLLNRSVEHQPGDWFAWQAGYGVLTFGDRSLQDVVAYVNNQADHHAQNDLRSSFEPPEPWKPTTLPVLSPEGTS